MKLSLHFIVGVYLIFLFVAFLLAEEYQKLPGSYSVKFFDVNGESILIITKTGKNILVDSGQDGSILNNVSKNLPFFRRKLDLVILTHSHMDHAGGILPILKRIPVDNIILTGGIVSSYYYKMFIDELVNNNTNVFIAGSLYDFFVDKNSFIDIIYPFSEVVGKNDKNPNDFSIVFKFITPYLSVLFTGDAEKPIEESIITQGIDVNADILKVGHQGSRTSTSKNFLSAVSPAVSVIIANKKNPYGHPHKEIVRRLENINSDVYVTKYNGNIELSFNNRKVVDIITDK